MPAVFFDIDTQLDFLFPAGALYVPVEIYELVHHATWLKVVILVTNLAVVAYMAWALRHRAEQDKERLGSG